MVGGPYLRDTDLSRGADCSRNISIGSVALV